MKKKIIKYVTAVLLVLSVLGLTSCEKYKSSWNASGFVHSNTSKSAEMGFWKFEGTIVFKLNCKDSTKEVLNYSGKLNDEDKEENGRITVYCDMDGTKKELFSLKNGESVEASLDKLKEGIVYIIVETDGQCENGSLEFNIE